MKKNMYSPCFTVCFAVFIMLIFLPMVTPEEYESPVFITILNEEWSYKSLATMIRNSINANLEMPWDVIKTVLKGPMDVQVLVETVIQEQLPLLLPAVIGLLAAVLVPIITIIFCCCRCCGNCGSSLSSGDINKQGKAGLIYNGLVILVAVGIVLAAAACVPTSGTRVKNSPIVVVDSLQHGAHDIPIFVSTLVEESKVVVSDHLNGTIEIVKGLLRNLPRVLSEPLLNSTSGYITYIENDVQQILTAVDSLSDVESDTNQTVATILQHVSILELTLNDVNTNLSTIKSKCETDGELFCDQLPDGSADPVNYDTAPLTDLTAAITELVDVTKDVNLTGYLSMGNDTFASIPEIIYNSSKDTIDDVIEVLDSVPDTVLPTVFSTLDTVGNMTGNIGLDETLDEIDADIERIDATIDPIFNIAMKAVGVYIGLIGGLALVGLLLGCLCRSDSKSQNYGRNKTTACGASCLMCSVFLAAVSILIILLLGSVFLIIGGNLTITCKTIQDVTIVENLIENEILFDGDNLGKVMLDNENINISVQAFMQNCRAGGTLFSSFNVSEMVNLTDIFNASSFVPSLDDGMYDSINETIQDINVFDTAFLNDISSQLAFPENSSADNIQELKDSVAEVDLLQMSQNFTNLADTLTDEWYSNYFRTMAQRLAYVNQHTKIPLQETILDLESNLNDLNGTGVDIQSAVADLNSTLSSMQAFIQSQAVTVMFQSIDNFLASMLNVPDDFINNILHTMTTEVGECKIVGDMYDSITGSFCIYFLDSFNTLWAGLFSAGIVFIFLMTSSCRLGQYFRRPNSADMSQGNNKNFNNARDIHISIEHPHRQRFGDNSNNNAVLFEAPSKVQMMKNFLTRKRGMFRTGADSPQLLRIKKLSESMRASRESRDLMLYQNPLHLYQSIELRDETPSESPESHKSVKATQTNHWKYDNELPGCSTSDIGDHRVYDNIPNHSNGHITSGFYSFKKVGDRFDKVPLLHHKVPQSTYHENIVHGNEPKCKYHMCQSHDYNEVFENILLDSATQSEGIYENETDYRERLEGKGPTISTANLCGSFQDLHPSGLQDSSVNNNFTFDSSDSESSVETSLLVGVTGSVKKDRQKASLHTANIQSSPSTAVSSPPGQLAQHPSDMARITCSLCKNTSHNIVDMSEFHQNMHTSGQEDGHKLMGQDGSEPMSHMSESLEAHLNDFEDIYQNLSDNETPKAVREKDSDINKNNSSKVKHAGRKYLRNSGQVLNIQVQPYAEKQQLEASGKVKSTRQNGPLDCEEHNELMDNARLSYPSNYEAEQLHLKLSAFENTNNNSGSMKKGVSVGLQDIHSPESQSVRQQPSRPQQLAIHAYCQSPESMNKSTPIPEVKCEHVDGSFYQRQITELSEDLSRYIACSEKEDKNAVRSLSALSSKALLEGALSRVVPHEPVPTYALASTAKQSSKLTYM